MQGTGSGGEYGILTSYVSDDTSVTKDTPGLTEPGQITTLDIVVDNDNPEDIVPERIVTSEVLLNNIIKAYELGWITKKKIKNNNLQGIIKRYNKII